jgi:hypothetical protein
MTGSGSGAVGRGRPIVLRLSVLLLWAVLPSGCDAPNNSKPCKGLVYKEYGLSQEEYQPCAAAMVAALDSTEQHLVALFNGEKGARSKAWREVRLLKKMIALAGGRKMFGESWDDESLNRLNRAIANACWQYEAATLAPGNRTDFENGRRNHAEATRILRELP